MKRPFKQEEYSRNGNEKKILQFIIFYFIITLFNAFLYHAPMCIYFRSFEFYIYHVQRIFWRIYINLRTVSLFISVPVIPVAPLFADSSSIFHAGGNCWLWTFDSSTFDFELGWPSFQLQHQQLFPINTLLPPKPMDTRCQASLNAKLWKLQTQRLNIFQYFSAFIFYFRIFIPAHARNILFRISCCTYTLPSEHDIKQKFQTALCIQGSTLII